MSGSRNRFLDDLDKLYLDAIAALSSGDSASCLQILREPYSSDDALERYPIAGADDFAVAVESITGSDHAEIALDALTDGRVIRRQCQLDLLRAIAALSNAGTEPFVQAIAELCDRASFLEFDEDELAERVVEAAIALNRPSDFLCARLALWAAKRRVAKYDWAGAKFWLKRVDLHSVGPFAQSARQLMEQIANHVDW
jgi:hypothetical protein